MNNDELKEKIAQIIADYFCPQRNEHKNLWGDDRLCYSKMNFAECERVAECTDALIAAGIGDLETVQKIAASATAMAVLEAAKAEQRAEVAESALNKFAENVTCEDCPFFSDCSSSEKMKDSVHSNYCFAEYLRQAEKELAEEGKR